MASSSYTTPHSCAHCEQLVLVRPEDDPALHNGAAPGRPLLLLSLLGGVPGVSRLIQDLQQTFLFETERTALARYVADGCAFYQFVATGLEKARRDARGSMQQTGLSSAAFDRQRQVIGVKLGEDAVEIGVVVDLSRNGSSGHGFRPLHGCVFGVFAEEGEGTPFVGVGFTWAR